MIRRLGGLVAALLITGGAVASAQTQDADLERGTQLVKQGEYGQAILLLDQVARRLSAHPAQKRLAAQAYLSLGIAYLGEGQETLARASFRDAIIRDETLQLPAFDVSPKVRDLFQKAKDEITQQKAQTAPVKEGGGGKGLWIALGVLGVGGAGAAVALGGGGGDGSGAGSALPPGISFNGGTPAVGSTISLASGQTISLSFGVVHNRSQIGSVLQVVLRTAAGARCFDQSMGLAPDARANEGQSVPITFSLRSAEALCPAPFTTTSLVATLDSGVTATFSASYVFVP